MAKNAKDKRPTVKPVIKAELTENNKTVRLIAVVVLLALGVTAIVYAAAAFFGNSKGYTEIDANGVYSDMFILNYDIGASGASASSDNRRISKIYSDSLDRFCSLLSSDTEHLGKRNLYYINHHAGEDIEVDPFLYSALLAMEESGSRFLYLGLVLEWYDSLFSASEDVYAEMNDPKRDAESAEICKAAARYASDPDAINLKLLGNNTVRLEISEEYTAFAASFGGERFLDFGVFENAFVVDGIAEAMIAENMTYGAISSYDGYSRNLDGRDRGYSFTVSGKYVDKVYPVCVASYEEKIASATFKSYPTAGLGSIGYYMYSDGESAHMFIDAKTGLCKNSLNDLLVASSEKSCVELALAAYGAFVADEFDSDSLLGVCAVWVEGSTVCKTGDALSLGQFYSDKDVSFELAD